MEFCFLEQLYWSFSVECYPLDGIKQILEPLSIIFIELCSDVTGRSRTGSKILHGGGQGSNAMNASM
jgi:hypothetical protein